MSFLVGLLHFAFRYIFLNPYKNAAYAAFYRKVSVYDPYHEL